MATNLFGQIIIAHVSLDKSNRAFGSVLGRIDRFFTDHHAIRIKVNHTGRAEVTFVVGNGYRFTIPIKACNNRKSGTQIDTDGWFFV